MRRRGSSPHARGARVGAFLLQVLPEDHPRMRGEHESLGALALVDDGIIPACAGSTVRPVPLAPSLVGSSPHARGARLRGWMADFQARDHPRMRGEHLRLLLVHVHVFGIIPACAGSTGLSCTSGPPSTGSSPHARGALIWAAQSRETSRDHPRMRGEHFVVDGVPVPVRGSSPHARGAPSPIRQPS